MTESSPASRSRPRRLASAARSHGSRRLSIALATALVLLASPGCRHTSAPPPERLQDVPATVRRFPQDGHDFVLVPEAAPLVLYRPDELPVPFRSEGLRVVISGQVRAPHDPQADSVVPIVLTAIRRRDAARPGPL